MKKLLFIALLVTSLSSYAQYSNPKGWKSPELYLPTSILVSTFAVNDYLGTSVTYGTRCSIALTGMTTSVLTHFIFKKIRLRGKHNKKLIVFHHK